MPSTTPAGRDGGSSRNGKRAKTIEAGPVEIAVPRDREASPTAGRAP